MKNRIHIIAVLLAAFVFSGCVAPVPKMVNTASGKPEVTISAPLSEIKSAIIAELVNGGYSVDQDSDYMLRASRPIQGREGVGASIAIGNAYSTNRRVTTFTFVKQGNGIRVVASTAWSAQMPGGQMNTMELTDNGNVFNAYQTTLQQIKARLERG